MADSRDSHDDERPRAVSGAAEWLRRLNSSPALIGFARSSRRRLPGDSDFGDPLSTAGSEPSQLVGRRIGEVNRDRPSALREVGLSALQVFQSFSEAQGRGRGDRDLAILFTDLVGFSSWSLEVGDTLTLDLLREVGLVLEPAVSAHGGEVVKRLGDGLMAVFAEPRDAVDAALEAGRGLAAVDVGGHRPQMRAGVHFGRPRKLGGDYYGADVNIAARVAEGASGDEVLVSGAIAQRLGDGYELKRKRRFRAKGAPRDLEVYSLGEAVRAGD
ncbi:MAG TPA: adenylate/guanylate cyclase domain-containing protein [Solirubrobacteraceae bacterium]|nr:adenylate/guanylate cyclase domain-containing protein [Solirubrobacteraceae bacterium]